MTLNPKQFQLFDPGPPDERHPGDLTPDQWESREDISYHVGHAHNFSGDALEHPTAHFGTKEAGMEIARGQRFHFGDDEPGYMYQRRIHDMDSKVIGDWEANTADMAFRMSGGSDVSQSLLDSGDPDIAEALAGNYLVPDESKSTRQILHAYDRLESAKSVAYENEHEDQGSISHIVPHGGHSSYLDDLISSPNRPQWQKDWASGPGRNAEVPKKLDLSEGAVPRTFYGHLVSRMVKASGAGNESEASDLSRRANTWMV